MKLAAYFLLESTRFCCIGVAILLESCFSSILDPFEVQRLSGSYAELWNMFAVA